ncbi:hypothetical protein C8R21_13024 [Nitrosospira multiformis]|uniref:Uncharacterized protein n=1 Tax=Nitrosospira multiformis TaxID=1231 RepID=A0A2T5I677_9PROT|nr:hypothetical protein [Nitrosospira multiformis]PTQ79312.1 hypothetical protein C8R21_13024 [Nitrosospira multiformis]
MRINLSRLTGNAVLSEKLLQINGDLPEKSVVFPGPFSGSANIEPTGSHAFDIDGEWIHSIELDPTAARFNLKVPAPLKFNGVIYLELHLTYSAQADQWTVELMSTAWFHYKFNARAMLGEWLMHVERREPPVLKVKGRRGFPIDEWGLVVSPMKWIAADDTFDHVLNAGIFGDVNGRNNFVIIPESNTGRLYEASGGLKLLGLQKTALGSKAEEWRVIPLAIAFPLHRNEPLAMWRGLVSWAPVQTKKDQKDDGRLKAETILEMLWNRPARRALMGARIENAAQPVVPLPVLTVTEMNGGDSREKHLPLLFIEAPRNDLTDEPEVPRLRRVFFSGKSEAIELNAKFYLHAKLTSAPDLDQQIPILEFSGKIDKPLPPIPTDVANVGETKEHLLEALTAALNKVENGASDDLLLHCVAVGNVTTPGSANGWIIWGSLQFQVPSTEGQLLECFVRGNWTADECDPYPEVILHMKGCQVRTSASSDAADRDLSAAFSVQSGLEDDLQRESDVLRFARRREQPSRKCDIRIRHRTDRGRVAVSRVEVYATERSPFGNESVVLQLRPFSVAVVQPVDIDTETGELIAVWSSNDPEGVQWRVPDATTTITLPPQAVGEAMERGARFWKPLVAEKPWIDTTKPIAYRFSPPTQLVVRPSVRERRYNKSPANFSALLADAKVESFTTETIYPIQAKFEVSMLGLPDIRIRETGSMLGRPAENLPPPIDVQEGTEDPNAKERWFRGIFASEIATYATNMVASETVIIRDHVVDIRNRQVAAKASFEARLAEYHVYDPWVADGRLGLSEGLAFRLRDTRYGARPLLNPLPHWKVDKGTQTQIDNNDLLPAQKETIHVADDMPAGPRFLSETGDWADVDPDGAFVGGIVHTMEFPSELVAVLRNPVATRGRIENLTFTALGANAHTAVAFDEGRTIFVGETSYGQLSRLIKIRIGRVAVLWNRARHVIVYERTTVPSAQFATEQEIGAVKSRGWPILRKTEEYVEPLEPVRVFADEAQVKDNRAGFIRASEFITPRIYVNGAWGRDLDHGYEIQLWDEKDTSSFYPKPKLSVQAHAGGTEVVRCLLDEPQHIYFYSNTEVGKGDNTDAWPSYRGVDQPLSTPRLKVVTTGPVAASERDRQNALIDTPQLPAPRLDGLRRPRFDMKVVCEGKVNLQHSRGKTEMLGVMDIVTVMRSAAADAEAECNEGVEKGDIDAAWKTRLDNIKAVSNRAAEVASAGALRAKAEAFIEKACERIASGADCKEVKKQITEQVSTLFGDARKGVKDVMANIPALPQPDGLLTRAVDELERELVGIERAIRAPFDKMLVDLAALSAGAQGDAVNLRARAVAQLDSDAQIAKTVIGKANESVMQWKARLDNTVSTAQGSVEKLLTNARASVDKVSTMADLTWKQLEPQIAVQHCTDAIGKLRALEHHKVYGKVMGRCADALEGVRVTLRDGLVEKFWNEAHQALKGAAQGLLTLLDSGIAAARAAATQSKAVVDALATLATDIPKKLDDTVDKVRKSTEKDLAVDLQYVLGEIEKIHANAGAAVGSERNDLLLKWRNDVVIKQMKSLRSEAKKVEAQFVVALTPVLDFAKHAAQLLLDLSSEVDDWLVMLESNLITDINGFDCTKFDELRAKVRGELQKIEEQVRDRITGPATTIIDESTQAKFQQLESDIREKVKGVQGIADEVAKGMKLVKALGELPQLPTLTFNADRAEYVFHDLKEQIETSPFAAKLREIDTGLKELGLAVPTQKLLDQIVPNSLKDVDFNKVFRNLGAMDFTDFFKRFQLPEIRKDQLQITHGLDKRTRTAWVSTKVNAQFNEEKALFEFAGIAVSLAKMDMQATSDMSIGLNREHSSKTDAKLKADWALAFSGSKLATFHDVLLHYNGSSFDFDIEPKKVELHPTLKFVDEFAKRFQPELPPAIELVKDSRGIPVGVKAQMHTQVVLPPLGIIEIGPLLIRAGLAMRITPRGKFQVDANVSVGSKDAPVWVQVSYLGGGMWLEARASYENGVYYEASVGLALGGIKAFNLASVARGSFTFLLFAYATMSDKTGGSLRAGLQVAGNARILGIANASVVLLLEAVHGSGKTEGRGSLDVSIDICWCYTLHVRKDVNHQIN